VAVRLPTYVTYAAAAAAASAAINYLLPEMMPWRGVASLTL